MFNDDRWNDELGFLSQLGQSRQPPAALWQPLTQIYSLRVDRRFQEYQRCVHFRTLRLICFCTSVTYDIKMEMFFYLFRIEPISATLVQAGKSAVNAA